MRTKKFSGIGLRIIFSILFLLGITSCQQNDIDDDPCFNMFNTTLTSSDNTYEILSDVCNETPSGGCSIINDVAMLQIENLPKNSSLVVSDAMDVVITKYEVYYERRDEGTLVPPPLSFPVTWWISIGGVATFDFSIVTHEQKLLPPLSDLREEGYDRETGNFTIETVAHVILSGHTRAGCKIVIEVVIPIKFADFAE
ncbi:MAG: hypothetical protein A2161_20450 [Candidatus Schekmanbacteria bacterium RBG_13_48_7]|uniref:Uncharacterized protein n=1 Tax=Candidatus Schekmanbacteria bacterium RBG_13_48_7 TaxID=1817878 RepID=A0A1F7RP22_9BACT|nr:MAG: hypothetical protein A2161_20450 [Candidatus Schekmanbacteria bacterium RBG_13_48_7]